VPIKCTGRSIIEHSPATTYDVRMVAIRAHFDGQVIIPDEPVNLPADAQVVVLVDADGASSPIDLDRATREYYLGQSAADRAEDAAWGDALARDSGRAWEHE
jgi:hypothetical protein